LLLCPFASSSSCASMETKPGWTQQSDGLCEAGHKSQTGVIKTPIKKTLFSTASSNGSHKLTANLNLKTQADSLPGMIRLPSEMDQGIQVTNVKVAACLPRFEARDGSGWAKVPAEQLPSQVSSGKSFAADGMRGGNQGLFHRLGNLRDRSLGSWLPDGKCIYIQSGDPSDFDGS